MIWTVEFWKGAGERSIKTFLQVFVAVVTTQVGADAVGVDAGLQAADWTSALSVAALATLLSLATSVGDAAHTSGEKSREKGRHEAV